MRQHERTPMLLERGTPLQILASLAREAAAGRGRVALIEGKAGIGKTALLREFAQPTSASSN